MKTRFGSRGSDLALTQTRMVMDRLRLEHPDAETSLRIIKTTGDNKPDAPLDEIGGLGAFTREIEVALLNREIDVAVHSLKDLPTQQPDGLIIAAVAGRERPTDALISNGGHTLDTLPENAVVGTSSLRRKAQLTALRPDLRIRELRGNVPTRMRRVREGDLDAALIALAGLIRLGLSESAGIWEIPLERLLPAPGQGALALETRSDDDRLIAMLAPLHDTAAAVAVQCERAALQAFGGGCRAPLGVYAHTQGDSVHVQAFAANMDSGKTIRLSRNAPAAMADQLGRELGRALREALEGRS